MRIDGKLVGTFGRPQVGVYVLIVDRKQYIGFKNEPEDKPILIINLRSLRKLMKLLRIAESLVMQLENPDPGYKG